MQVAQVNSNQVSTSPVTHYLLSIKIERVSKSKLPIKKIQQSDLQI